MEPTAFGHIIRDGAGEPSHQGRTRNQRQLGRGKLRGGLQARPLEPSEKDQGIFQETLYPKEGEEL